MKLETIFLTIAIILGSISIIVLGICNSFNDQIKKKVLKDINIAFGCILAICGTFIIVYLWRKFNQPISDSSKGGLSNVPKDSLDWDIDNSSLF